MNNPYPTAAALRVEAVADNLFIEHSAAVNAFQTAVHALHDTICRLEFPLGSPCSGYDVTDVLCHLQDWMIPNPNRYSADDIAAEKEAV